MDHHYILLGDNVFVSILQSSLVKNSFVKAWRTNFKSFLLEKWKVVY